MRLWAEDAASGRGGGPSYNVTCSNVTADGMSCGSALSVMKGGWVGRTSAVAILYNNTDFTLPKPRPKSPAHSESSHAAAAA